jgi:signal transduction histidine kinase
VSRLPAKLSDQPAAGRKPAEHPGPERRRLHWGRLLLGRLTIRSKILLGFVVVLLAFGAATLHGAWAVHRLGEQLRLVALGYSNLRLELQDQQTIQANLQRRLAELEQAPHGMESLQAAGDAAVAADRKLRRLRLLASQQHVLELRRTLPRGDAAFLLTIERDLSELLRLYGETDAGKLPLASARQIEERAAVLLQQMSSRLTNKVLEVVTAGERDERRTTLMTVALSLIAALCSFVVLLLVQATLRPLRRLSESAKEVARGNYRERVAADSPDEIGALGREFNAMAAALAEREQRLRRSEQLATVGKMAAQITHEVRNPLTSIGLNAELLADEFLDPESEARGVAQAIVKEVDRLTDITEQYLRFARLPEPRFEPHDVRALVRSLLLFLDEELRTRGVRVAASLDAPLPAVMVDDNQLRQALLNLIRNAAEAMAELPREERQLTLRTRIADGADEPGPPGSASERPARIALDVIDRGPGIPAERQRQIFEPFFTTKQGGTGLGLALAHEVVARHGGVLSVYSPEPPASGRGTRFTVELPAAPSPGPAGGSQV